MEIARLQPDGLVVSAAFSHVAIAPAGAATIYVGGQNGVDADGKIVSDDVAEQSARAIDNASNRARGSGRILADVVQWTVFMAEDADLNAAQQAGPRLTGPGAPPLVTMARVAALGVPGAPSRAMHVGGGMTTLTGTTSNGVSTRGATSQRCGDGPGHHFVAPRWTRRAARRRSPPPCRSTGSTHGRFTWTAHIRRAVAARRR